MTIQTSRREFLHAAAGIAAASGISGANASAGSLFSVSDPMSLTGRGYINPRKVLLYECTRREIRERLEQGELKAAIIPTGSTEQHNEHMAMIMDTAGALLMSQLAALRLFPAAIVTTPVPIGYSPYWMNRKGTLTLRKEIFQEIIYDICDSLKTHGITNIFVCNGHGGNQAPIREKLPEIREKLGVKIEVNSYWESIPKERAHEFLETGDVPGHASEMETAIALAAFPERIRYEGVDHDAAKLTLTPEERKGDKAGFEASKLGSAEKGEKIISHAAEWVAEQVKALINS